MGVHLRCLIEFDGKSYSILSNPIEGASPNPSLSFAIKCHSATNGSDCHFLSSIPYIYKYRISSEFRRRKASYSQKFLLNLQIESKETNKNYIKYGYCR